MRVFPLISFILFSNLLMSQNGFGNQWIFGRPGVVFPSGTILDFNENPREIVPIFKQMELEGSCAIMCDSVGKLLFYSNGCYIANANHQMMMNGDSIGKGFLESSYCNTGGSPLTQGIIALPKPGNDRLYYIFYTDIEAPYENQPFFPLAPVTIFYSLIDMDMDNGLGAVTIKNNILLQDTFSRDVMQAVRHANGKDWWIIVPKSHSNCYWTFLLQENGVNNPYLQCIGQDWGDKDINGQTVFAPNRKKYARFNYYYGLNLFDFDNASGLLSNPTHVGFGTDTFSSAGVAFSSNSRYLYASAYENLWQFDARANDLAASQILIATLNTPPNVPVPTRFNQARLAPDGKIYIAGNSGHTFLHVINHPNCYGQACDLQQYSIPLAAPNRYTMPNLPEFKQWNEADSCNTVNTIISQENGKSSTIKFYPNPTSAYISAEGLNTGDKIEFINIYGKLYKSITYTNDGISVLDLPDGTYFVHVSDEKSVIGNYLLIKL